MYKVYLDDRLITIAESGMPASEGETFIKLTGNESVNILAGYLQSFEENKQLKSIFLCTHDLLKTWETFCSIYILMEAAGGIVLNKAGKLLMIFRNDRWDLPKGKIEVGENQKNAAIREVTEETGIGMLSIEHECSTTYHIYPFKKKKILKLTYWFRMKSNDATLPIPQLEEGITLAQWMKPEEVKKAVKFSYPSIVNLLKDSALFPAD